MVLISSTTDIKACKPLEVESTGANSTAANIHLGGNAGENIDELNTNGVTSQQTTKRTCKQLYDAIASICLQNGLDVNKAKNIGLLSIISGKTETELLNVEQSEITKIVQTINNAINAIKEDIPTIKNGTEKLTFDLIKNYVKLLNGEVPKGWDSVESFRKAQRKNGTESLAERLERMYNFDIKGKTPDQIAAKLEAYFDSYFQSLEGSREQVDNLQLTDFTKLLFNSTPEEYNMFRDAIEYLVSNNRHKGYEAILESFDNDTQRTEFANKTTYEQVQTWNTKADQRGEVPSAEDAALNTAAVLKWKDTEHIEEYHEIASKEAIEFYSDKENLALIEETKNNPEIIENIQEKLVVIEKVEYIKQKLENKEDISDEERAFLEANANVALTDEEKKYLDAYSKDRHFRGDNAGQIIGVGTNTIIDDESKENLLTTINSDAYTIGEKAGDDFYREVLSEVAKYAKTLSEEDKAAFETLMKDTIGENYTIVDNDIKNGTKTELSQPLTSTKPEVQGNKEETPEVVVEADKITVDPRYNNDNNSNTIDYTRPQTLVSELYTNQVEPEVEQEKAPQDEAEAVKGGLSAVKSFIKNTGTNVVDTALNILNLNYIVGKAILSWAFEKYDMLLNDSEKADECNGITNNKNKIKAASMIDSPEALGRVETNNSLVAKYIKKRMDELKELKEFKP